MTGRGQRGGSPRRDHWRGGREEKTPRDGGAPARGESRLFSTWVEVEELPAQSLAPRNRSRLPVTGLVAAAAVAVLLAGGLGLLGGRPGAGALPAASVANAPAEGSPAAVVDTEPPMPRVTPWSSCSQSPGRAPQAVLEVNGRQHFGEVEVLDLEVDLASGDGGAPILRGQGNLDAAVDVPMDAVAEIWVMGGSCAIAWNLALVGPAAPEPQVLESVANEERDPAVAAQNRFQVFVAPHAGDHLLRAVLVFEDVVLRATWSIHVPELEPPGVTLESERGGIATAVGCDVTQRLVNDWEQRLNPCSRDVGREPAPRADLRAGEPLEFSIAGWAARNTTVVCGNLIERTFEPLYGMGCIRERDPLFAGVRFSAPTLPGPLTLAISTCATRMRIIGSGFEELCGTWYANVRMRE